MKSREQAFTRGAQTNMTELAVGGQENGGEKKKKKKTHDGEELLYPYSCFTNLKLKFTAIAYPKLYILKEHV